MLYTPPGTAAVRRARVGIVDEGGGPKGTSELRHALQKLTNGAGVQRTDLLEALQGELRPLQQCWSVNLNNGPRVAQQTIAANLRAHFANLTPRRSRQQLSVEDRRRQYEHAIDVCFNASRRPELDGKDLTQRQAWLDEKARGLLRIDVTTVRRDLSDALDQIERQILGTGFEPVQAGQATAGTGSRPRVATLGRARLPRVHMRRAGPPRIRLPRIRPRRPAERRAVAITAAAAVAVTITAGGFSALGIELSQGGHPGVAKLARPQVRPLPRTVSDPGIYQDQEGTYAALRTPSGVFLDLGIANITEGATRWGVTADATYAQSVETLLSYQTGDGTHQETGITAQLLQPFSHAGNTWIVTWCVTAEGSTSNISVSVNVGRPDAKLVYVPGATKLTSPDASGKTRTRPVPDAQVLAPSQPLQTLYPGSSGRSNIAAYFLVEIPAFTISAEAQSPVNGNWFSSLYVLRGGTLPISVTIENDGDTPAYGTSVGFALPGNISYVPGSSSIGHSWNSTKPLHDGIIVPDYHDPGISLGTVQPGQKIVIRFKIRIDVDALPGRDTADAYVVASNVQRYASVLTINIQ